MSIVKICRYYTSSERPCNKHDSVVFQTLKQYELWIYIPRGIYWPDKVDTNCAVSAIGWFTGGQKWANLVNVVFEWHHGHRFKVWRCIRSAGK